MKTAEKDELLCSASKVPTGDYFKRPIFRWLDESRTSWNPSKVLVFWICLKLLLLSKSKANLGLW